MTVLVTGGAGYIGAHVVRILQEQGTEVVVVDNLSTGRKDRIGGAPLVELDVAGEGAVEVLTETMKKYNATAVIHFAAQKQVGESVARPAYYYQQNVGGLANVIAAMENAGTRDLVFSSSAATYGMPPVAVVEEDVEMKPINPYGETKLIGEWLGRAASKAWGMRFAGLRYFNVAGAGWDDLGDPAILNLIPMVLERVAKGNAPLIFGADYDTPDGTCVRDYIHVLDLAKAHVAALNYLQNDERTADVFNVSTGEGASVKQIIDGLAKASGIDIQAEIRERRAGDPPHLVGSPKRINEVLGWNAEKNLDDILNSAWSAWQAGPNRIEL
ncbi:UDP-glucose 4-epimerase GalE [Timonella senegalensis]|uniref:UDP-glucose 4-epimerase GalE n=1 Tax=Timonella senegalensis TaxID=1465825 RepID=UPI00031A7C8C|nr:UDP-glucose 4-epimerase GalE [Timonella senegalensis]